MSDVENKLALRELIDEYFRAFEERRVDPATLETIFSDDVAVDFPAGSHRGIDGLAELNQKIIALWDRTLHQVTNHHIVLDGDRAASVHATLTATHVHRENDPGQHLRIGAYIDASAIHATHGWRLATLAIHLIWTEGDPPTAAPIENRSD